MTTFEEDVVEIYYNLNDFFTIKNIPFSAVETRKGGAGRGEIDILAIHVKDKNFKNCSHIEASFSMTDGFPHVNSGKTIIRKFFSNDSEAKIKEIVGNTPYSCIMITSDFKRDTKERLKNKIIKGGGKVLNLVGRDRGNSLILEIQYKNRTKSITIYTFRNILFKLMEIFDKKRLLTKNFQDPRLRTIQHYMHLIKKGMV